MKPSPRYSIVLRLTAARKCDLGRRFSLGRVLAKGSPATAVWTDFAIFAFNLWQQT